MKKLIGIGLFLALTYGALIAVAISLRMDMAILHGTMAQRIGLYGIITLAAAFVIVTGNIDLSMGSTVGLCGTVTCVLLMEKNLSPWAALPLVVLIGAAVGLINGVLVTYLRVQAFVVTLCGMFVYRGLARWIADDRNLGVGGSFGELKAFFQADLFGVPVSFLILVSLLAIAGVVLHLSVSGRCFYAIGSNERAAHFAGIATNRYKVLAFVVCSTLTAFYSIVWVFTYQSVQPSAAGSGDELLAIAGVVLGGFSLRGGDGTVLGVLIGTAIIRILPTTANYFGVPNALEPAVIGLALLAGAVADELIRRRSRGTK